MKKIILILSLLIMYFHVIFVTVSQEGNNQRNSFNEGTNGQGGVNTNNFIKTASDFFDEIAGNYATFKDIKANIIITNSAASNTVAESEGTIFIKPPNKMRVNFNLPKGQVINNNGEEFYIYIPNQNVALYQKKKPISISDAAGILTPTGLSLLSKNYFISYLDKPEYKRYEEDPTKKVIQLNLTWKNPSQNFRDLILFIGEDNIIYRVDAITYNRQNVRFVFSNLEINKGIPDARFDYEPPPTAHVVEKFLFDEELANE